ncbi:iron reductase [Leuconostoc mesenteroides]|uniref:iron reductase n=1 Tax=Leuconostoc mesenteroides TaxID=1245 RepID=UPI001CBD928B|nr:iron reductase [Leuconostoc mesenteroides]MBZ1525817.1 iron reductase [Leuconostoc mesenteroides]
MKQHHEDQPLIIVAGGIGITPFISIAQMAVERQQTVTFLYSTKHEKDAIYFKHQVGRFSDTQIVDIMQKNGIYLLAGPHAMTKYWRNFLKNRGVADSSIYFEPFEW